MKSVSEICVLLPIYNGSEYLRNAIQSVLAQTYTDYDFIIIDDGSSDESRALVQEFADPRIQFYQHEHLGMDEQLNWALNSTKSTFIAMMEQDNILSPNRLEVQVEAIRKNTRIDVISSSFILIDSLGKRLETHWLPVHDKDIRELFPVFCPIAFGSVLARRERMIQSGGFDPATFPNNDYDLWLRMLRSSYFANIKEPLLLKRIHKHAATVVGSEEAAKQRLFLANKYLEKEIAECSEKNRTSELLFKSALCHYYYGSMSEARKILVKLLSHPPDIRRFWRYFIVTLMGDAFIRWLRKHGAASWVTNIFRSPNRSGKYFRP